MKNKFIYLICLTLLISAVGCTKESPVGPPGPQGEQGDPGKKGNTGEKGENGDDEGANVVVSDWSTQAFTGAQRKWSANITDNRITEAILDKGDVSVYVKIDGAVYELNYFTNSANIIQSVSMGKIQLQSTFDASTIEFRYILIPAGAKSTSLSSTSMGMRTEKRPSYKEYQKIYGFNN